MITSNYFDSELISNASQSFQEYNDYIDGKTGLKLHSYPFRSLVLPNFIQDSEFLFQIRDAIQRTELHHKSNDLYEFYQSNDLKSSQQSCIRQLLKSLFSPEWIQILSQITGLQLSNTVDVACQKYPQNGFLLCHDDDLGDALDSRRIAFILYLVDPSWNASCGGQLQLFNTNEKGQPKDIVRSIVPQWNHFAFFEVTSTSFHQVQEVFTSMDRLSITGWFHGPRESIPHSLSSLTYPTTHMEEDLRYWINPLYLSDTHVLNTQFSQDSFLCLKDFIKTDLYEMIELELNKSKWSKVGIANSKRYSILDNDVNPSIVTRMYSVFHTNAFKAYLQTVTGLQIDSIHNLECRSFESGDYTLVRDDEIPPAGLDLIFSMSTTDHWDDSFGGQLHYICQEDTLISLLPNRNELFLCFRDDQVLSFVRYLNAKSVHEKRREFAGLYLENN